MQPLSRALLVCWLLAAGLGTFACGTTRQGERPRPTDELGESGASGERSGGGASSSGSAGAATQAGTAGIGGGPTIELAPMGGAGVADVPEEPVVTPHAAMPCDNPQPFPLGGGYLVCEDKSLRIGERSACPTRLPRDTPTEPLFFEDCALDVDCTASAHGFCAHGQCKYGCVSDDECGGGLCFCGADVGTCVSAECRSDADCPADYPCTGNLPFGIDTPSFRCQSPLDTCQSDYDCAGPRVHCWVTQDATRRACIRDQIG